VTDEIKRIAEENGLNPYFLAAVADVESGGRSGFRNYSGSPGHPVIRFEPHHFNKRSAYRMPFTNCGRGFSRRPEETGWTAFLEAYRLDESAAIQATSWGMFQIMGFHFRNLGYDTPQEFRKAMFSETGQYESFAKFIKSHKVLRRAASIAEPQDRDFRDFARSYNGSSNVDNYSRKIARAYAREMSA